MFKSPAPPPRVIEYTFIPEKTYDFADFKRLHLLLESV